MFRGGPGSVSRGSISLDSLPYVYSDDLGLSTDEQKRRRIQLRKWFIRSGGKILTWLGVAAVTVFITSRAIDSFLHSKDASRPRNPSAVRLAGLGVGIELDHAMAVPKPRPQDFSIRCNVSRICDDEAPCIARGTSRDEALRCTYGAARRKAEVVKAIKWAWQGYQRCAMGSDELRPVTCTPQHWFNLGVTTIDSMDTLMLAGLTQEAQQAADWVESHLAISAARNVNVFEATIRVLGGLLSASHLSRGNNTFLHPAIELALSLLPAYHTASGLPQNVLDFSPEFEGNDYLRQVASLSEVSTLSLEFGYAAQIANRPDIAVPAMRVWDILHRIPGATDGLPPCMVNTDATGFAMSATTLGANADSYYEYLLKQWIWGGKRDPLLLEMYVAAIRGVRRNLLSQTALPSQGGLTFVTERSASGEVSTKMDHLVCFLPGLLALGHMHGIDTAMAGQKSDLDLAADLMHTCYSLYKHTPTGLAAEMVYFKDYNNSTHGDMRLEGKIGAGHFDVQEPDKYSLLRPETMESLFVMWRATHNEKYRDWGWQIFRALEMHARVGNGGGYSSLYSVLDVPASPRDKMESFVLAETLKYALLLFEDDIVLPLDQYVFNTEGHPLPILDSPIERSQRSWYLKGDEVPSNLHGTLAKIEILHQLKFFRRATGYRPDSLEVFTDPIEVHDDEQEDE